MKIKDISKDMLTGKDGQSYDIGRALWALMCLGYMVLTGYSIHKGSTVDFSSWAIGAAALLAGGGGGIALKASTEPGQPPAPVPTTPPDAEPSG